MTAASPITHYVGEKKPSRKKRRKAAAGGRVLRKIFPVKRKERT